MLLSADTRRGGGDRRRREEEGGGACAASMWRAVTGSCDLGSMCSTNTHTSTAPQPVVIVRLARDCVRNRLRFSRACVNACQRWQMVVWHVSVVWPWAWKHSKASELRKEHLLSPPLLSSPLLSSHLLFPPVSQTYVPLHTRHSHGLDMNGPVRPGRRRHRRRVPCFSAALGVIAQRPSTHAE